MRRYHRWLALLFGALILWIAGTAVAIQIGTIYANGGLSEEHDGPMPAGTKHAAGVTHVTLIPAAQAHDHEAEEAEARAAAAPRPGASSPAPPPRSPAKAFVHFVTDLHSGASFGPIGTILSLLSGLALIFFAVSGLWMYLQMFRARARRERPGESRWFW